MIEDYSVYEFCLKEKVQTFLEGLVIDGVIAFLFYNSMWAMIPGALVIVLYFREKKHILMRRRKNRLRRELKEFFCGLIVTLQTGKSMENAFFQTLKDVTPYCEKDSELVEELKKICAGIGMGISLEAQLSEFASRACLEELEYFSEVFSVAKRSGGNMISIMKNTIRMIQERMESEAEIQTVLSEKQLEFYLMSVIPLGIILYLRIGTGTLISCLYGNLLGTVVMTGCLIVYGGCVWYGKRLLEIED